MNPACVTSWVATQTDRPKSVRNRCVIGSFGGVVVLSRSFLDFSVGVGAFVIGMSQISSFFSHKSKENGEWWKYHIVFKLLVRDEMSMALGARP